MQKYPWLMPVYCKILNVFRRGHIHHALLFNSKWNNGEDILINAIIRWLICSNPNEFQNCSVCDSCQLMDSGNHPDYYQLDVDGDDQVIGIDNIRVCIDSIYKRAFLSKVKIVFIKCIEYLTIQSENALLKAIEEPPENTYFFFKTKEFMNISSTLLSRCIRWDVRSPRESLGLQWLMQQRGISDALLAQCALRLYNGAPVEAESVLQVESWKKRLSLCNSIYNALVNHDFLQILPCLSVSNSGNNVSIYWLVTLLLDALKWNRNIKKRFLINLDQIKLVSMISDHWNSMFLSNQLQSWLMLIYYFQKFIYVNRELLITYQLLNWQNGTIEFDYNLWSM